MGAPGNQGLFQPSRMSRVMTTNWTPYESWLSEYSKSNTKSRARQTYSQGLSREEIPTQFKYSLEEDKQQESNRFWRQTLSRLLRVPEDSSTF